MKENLLGFHASIAGGFDLALYHAKELKANTIQIFTGSQQRWTNKEITDVEIAKFTQAKEKTGIDIISSHNNYLTNLGSSDLEKHQKSMLSFTEELKRCHDLGISYLIFHPGAYLGFDIDTCLSKIVQSLLLLKPKIDKGPTRLLLETTAGQGTNVGYTFEQLAFIVKQLKSHLNIGICLDTCHIFAAGYDITTKEKWQKVLEEFDNKIGLDHLKAFHLNDSLKPLGSRVDRHASLGQGFIGLEAFEFIMSFPKFRSIPKYLETPNPDNWMEEIKMLQKMSG